MAQAEYSVLLHSVFSLTALRSLMKHMRMALLTESLQLTLYTSHQNFSLSNLLSPVERIQQRVKEYNELHYGK